MGMRELPGPEATAMCGVTPHAPSWLHSHICEDRDQAAGESQTYREAQSFYDHIFECLQGEFVPRDTKMNKTQEQDFPDGIR